MSDDIEHTSKLSQAISELRAYVPFKKRRQEDSEKRRNGSFNEFQVQKLDVHYELRDPNKTFKEAPVAESKHIEVGVVKPNAKSRSILEEIKAAFNHLRELQAKKTFSSNSQAQSSSLIIKYLSHGEGGKVALKANGGDLRRWIIKNDKTKQLRDVIAQILIAVDALHSKNKVHRDIKLENFLVHVVDGRVQVKLADIDTTINKDEKRSARGTRIFTAPECRTAKNRKLPLVDAIVDRDLYIRARKKPIDCYAVGCVIRDLVKYEMDPEHITPTDKKKLTTLYEGLMRSRPFFRYTIKQAMESDYFGANKKTCEKYFADLRQEHEKYDMYLGSYYYHPNQDAYPDYGNGFFTLPDPLKTIYMQAASLENQMQLVRHHSVDKESIAAINQRILLLENLISQQQNTFKNVLAPLILGINEAKQLLVGKFTLRFHGKKEAKEAPENENKFPRSLRTASF